MSRALNDDHYHGNPPSDLFDRRCSGKVGFTSKRQANGRVRVMAKQGKERDGFYLNAYKCRSCTRWHVGNSRY